MKSKLIILSVVVLMFSASQVFAGGGHDHGGHGEEAVKEEKGSSMEHKGSMMEENHSKSPNVGNKICPVSGEKIGGAMGKGVQVEHDGKIYNLCCAMCAKDFKKDPAKYIEIINEELEDSDHEEQGDYDEGEDHGNSKGSHEEKHDHSAHGH